MTFILTPEQARLRLRLLEAPLDRLTASARAVREDSFGGVLTYSRKVFIPLTQLCRDVCHYCTFAKAPREVARPYLTPDEVLEIARRGVAAGCKEALFPLGDKPELRYPAARKALAELGFDTTLGYLEHVAGRVLRETGLLPHINAGILMAADYERLRLVSASLGLMLGSAADRLCERGGPHHGSPDKVPAVRLASIAAAGEAAVPFTSGLLIGIGETRTERLDALFALQALNARHGHLQEVIIQNFRAKPGTRMADAVEPTEDDLVWTIAAARLILDPAVGVQAPPNLNPGRTARLIAAGLNDWGGISPVTIDHVNPEAAWPDIEALQAECAWQGHDLAERLAIWPRHLAQADRWLDRAVRGPARSLSDSQSLAREGEWSPGLPLVAPGSIDQPLGTMPLSPIRSSAALERCLARVLAGREPEPADVASLFATRGEAALDVVAAADELRRSVNGETVTYVINRNINYTNICSYSCSFCAFSKTSSKAGHRDRPYNLPLEEIASRTREARDKGATEVCLQGGIHPAYTGQTYLDICRAVKTAVPDMHVHAFSPLEIAHGAQTLGLSWSDLLRALKDEGLGSLPGTAAEILNDDARAVLCPDKLSTEEWLGVIEAAHQVGLRTTATIMFGHMDTASHWAEHLLLVRRLQARTGGFTEFVPLPFVHMQSPIYVRGDARRGPTWRETVLMHAVARIALHGQIDNIQASWVKLGLDGATACLGAGVNDLGGVLMNESISRAAGSAHGQELQASTLEEAVTAAGRRPARRTTIYGAPAKRVTASLALS